MEDEISILKSELLKSRQIYDRFHLKLPDKGKKLLNDMETKERQIQELQEKIAEKKVLVTSVSKDLKLPSIPSENAVSSQELKDNQSCNVKNSAIMRKKQISPTSYVNELSFEVSQKSCMPHCDKLTDSFCSQKESKSQCTLKQDESKDVSHDDFLFKKPSFTQYRDSSRKPVIPVIPPPSINPEDNKKLNSHINYLGSHNKKDLIQSSAIKEASVELRSSLMNCPSSSEEEEEPINLKTKLMKHQKTALKWLLWRETQIPRGGVLADDMGLGKTLTILSLILKAHEQESKNAIKEQKSGGTLIVCVASILHQWNSEVERHCKLNSLKVLIYHGSGREKYHKKITNYDVVLTTYDLIRNEGKSLQTKKKYTPLFEITWDRIILDEAHTIKNYKTQTAEWIFKLNGIKRWAVTGTPIHNDLKDFYCLLKFLQYEPFCELSTWKKLINDMTDQSVARRNHLVKNILLRRCKNDTDEETGKPLIPLPKKKSKISMLHLTEEEKTVYNIIEKELKEKYSKSCVKNISSTKGEKSNGIFLSYLLKLQQCCNHLSLLKEPVQDDYSNALDLDMSKTFETLNLAGDSSNIDLSESLKALNIEEPSRSIFNVSLSYVKRDFKYDLSDTSSKITKLIEKLKAIFTQSDNTEKCVVVSQWVTMLKIIGFHLSSQNINFHVIDGSTKLEDRLHISKDFNYNPSGSHVLLLSLKAGGVGLNLVGGNHLFLMDMHWNPALENQACDRIHRVGQTRDVHIYKFVCVGTIEEKIFEMQKQKKHLAVAVLNGAKSVSYLSLDDFKKLFEL